MDKSIFYQRLKIHFMYTNFREHVIRYVYIVTLWVNFIALFHPLELQSFGYIFNNIQK